MIKRPLAGIFAASFLTAAFAVPSFAQPEQDWVRTETRDDCLDYEALRRPLFGETHVHSAYSLDARLFRVRTDPYESYEFAKGAVQGIPPYDAMDNPSRTYQIRRPLDWMFVSDHAEGLGETQICFDDSYAGYSDPLCTDFRDFFFDDPLGPGPIPTPFLNFLLPLNNEGPTRYPQLCGATNADCLAASSLVWQDTQDAAEAHYDRSDACSFTTFVGYEWTSQEGGDNLHRNIVFRNENVQPIPFTAFDSQDPDDLFDNLDTTCMDVDNGCEALTITHNANTSQGRMFQAEAYDGSPLTAEDAAQRIRIEPLAEMFQNKGNSECRVGVGTSDEGCMLESMGRVQNFGVYNQLQTFERLSFVREALKEGYILQEDIGVNPFKIGFIGSTDGHSNLPGAVVESDFGTHGHIGSTNAQPEWILSNVNVNGMDSNGGGLAVVYAEENSRDAIFAAMQRKETYATSGPRMTVRFFGGRLPKKACDDPDLVTTGYNRGVPMGADLGSVKGSKSPSFLITAQKDAGGNGEPSTPLQRVEVIKAWVDVDGVRQEEVYHVAGTKSKSSNATVDTDTCTPSGDGHDSLCTVWSDPKFDPRVGASYYVRVTENPVCRWHKQLCNAQGIDCNDIFNIPTEWARCCNTLDQWPETIQERAWTSPIFYEPGEVGVAKGQLKYGKNGGDDKLKMNITLGKMPDDFDLGANDLTLVLRDDDDIINATIPAGSFIPNSDGSKLLFKDKAGTNGGITKALIKLSDKKANLIKVSTGKMDLSAADLASHKVELEMSTGAYSSIDRTQWVYDGKRLSVPK